MTADRSPVPADVGTDNGFRAFYDNNAAMVFGYLWHLTGGNREVAQELSQEAWCALVDEIRAGRTERATTTWLLMVARSRFIDRWRRERRLARPVRVAWTNDEPVDPWEPARTDVLDHLAALGSDHRLVLALRYLEQLTVPEIAELLGRSIPATHSLIARSRRDLRARVNGAHRG